MTIELDYIFLIIRGGFMVLLVVDTQKLITTENLYNYSEFVANVKELIETARKNSVEVIYVVHDDGEGEELTKGKEGYQIFEDFAPIVEEKIFEKNVNSAFFKTGLLEYLKRKNENEVMVVGLMTDYCIDATVKAGFEHGFKVVVPAYSNTTLDNEFLNAEDSYRYYNEKMWNERYAECVDLEGAIKLLKCNKEA